MNLLHIWIQISKKIPKKYSNVCVLPGDVATDEGVGLCCVQVVQPLGRPFDDGQTLLPGQRVGRALEEEGEEDMFIPKQFIWFHLVLFSSPTLPEPYLLTPPPQTAYMITKKHVESILT